MIVVLTGARKNVGDYLIGSRAKKLLRAFVDDEIVELDRFKHLDEHLDTINSSKALILCGGPAYASNIYPGIYPLVDDLRRISVPIIPFGLGWSGTPFNDPDAFSFDAPSKLLLKKIHENCSYSSCRDDITHSILLNRGYGNAIMTGCPVWYDLDSLGKPMDVKGEIKSIVFTTAAAPGLLVQNCRLLHILKKTFPKADIFCSFHRGILPDQHTSPKYAAAYLAIAAYDRLMGIKVVDVAYGLEKIDFYKEIELHVGYRVHAHLDFLSRRKPSILINEDGRGLGMVKSMGLPVLNINDAQLMVKYETELRNIRDKVYGKLMNVPGYIDATFEDMKKFLAGISGSKRDYSNGGITRVPEHHVDGNQLG